MNGLGVAIVSTSKGVMTDRKARGPASAAKCSASSRKEQDQTHVANRKISRSPCPTRCEVTVATRRDLRQGSARHADAARVDPRSTVEGGRQPARRSRRRRIERRRTRFPGTLRALVANMVQGVTKGFEKKLNLVGVGYRAQAQGDKLNLSLGFSHPVVHALPKGIKAATPTQTEIVIKGMDKQIVGQVAAEIRALPPARAVQGQGRALLRRDDRAQRDEEEVRVTSMSEKNNCATAPRAQQTRAQDRANWKRCA